MRNIRGLAALKHHDVRMFLLSKLTGTLGIQMQSVAVGWQVYATTHRALDLGYVGLVQFAPALLLALATGHVADRFDRRTILLTYYSSMVLCSLGLFLFSYLQLGSVYGIWPIYLLLVALGTSRAFANPAMQALLPSLLPVEDFGNAVVWSSTTWEIGTVLGPALGGIIYGLKSGPDVVYASCAVSMFIALGCVLAIRSRSAPRVRRAEGWAGLMAGIHYVRSNQILLGAISLDLFAVLLGGAIALLPIFARDILRAGPTALGMMRSAPAFGALIMAIFLAFKPLNRHAGKAMLLCVALFGVATCVFALSTSIALSMTALVVTGMADLVSVYVRQTLVQLKTPDAMRGRVSAVNQVFTGASNEFGEFESGLTAAWFGAVPATLLGGCGTLAVVALWAWRFPKLRDVDRLHD